VFGRKAQISGDVDGGLSKQSSLLVQRFEPWIRRLGLVSRGIMIITGGGPTGGLQQTRKRAGFQDGADRRGWVLVHVGATDVVREIVDDGAEAGRGWGGETALRWRLVHVRIFGAKLGRKLLVVAVARCATWLLGIAGSLFAQAVHDLVATAALTAGDR
jgi:hypothetical protein